MIDLVSKYVLDVCPFCGANRASVKRSVELYFVRCGKCRVRTDSYFKQVQAEEAWNARGGKRGEMKKNRRFRYEWNSLAMWNDEFEVDDAV